jgi:circadian clock protein KaiC
MNKKRIPTGRHNLLKTPSGIKGLDDITNGGLPQGRPTLICGGPGCGKTMMSMEFLVRGAIEHNEPGVFMAFEETRDELTKNTSSLGFDLDELVSQNKLALDHVHIDRSEIYETGEFDLDGIFIRLAYAIDSIGAKRVVLDTIEALFSGFTNMAILRAELRRLLRWLKDKGVTAIITGERGEGSLTRQGLEEYVSDCVILLDQRINEQSAIRRLRIIKYRGSNHGTNEYPFLIDENGISILPITSLGLEHSASTERLSSGIASLDEMLGGMGFYRGTSILVSGTAGSGKTSLSSYFINAACARGEKCLYFAFEESQGQLIRNMRSIGLDFEPWLKQELLSVHAARPTVHGLETHLTTMYALVHQWQPRVVVVDPISNLITIGTSSDVRAMLTRLVDFLKTQTITTLFTELLTDKGATVDFLASGVSSLMDTWILLEDIEEDGERNRCLTVRKSRGMDHSNKVREFLLSSHGIELIDVYRGADGVLTGSARAVYEMKEKSHQLLRQQELERMQSAIERQRQQLELQISLLQAEFRAKEEELVKARTLLQNEQQESLVRNQSQVQ